MRLRFFIICSVTPWILADTVNDGNKTTSETTTIETTTKTYTDETRRDALRQLLRDNVDHASIPFIEYDTYNDKIPGHGIESISNVREQSITEGNELLQRVPKLEDDANINILQHALREQAESSGICKNAEFLIKVLTTMIPLLKNDVPERSKTSYFLEILKDLIKTSPEVAEDYEVMYKINDLLQTLEKYHVKDFDSEHLLRTSNNTLRIPHGLNNVDFEYEMPYLQNRKCAAELLMVIKVVQEAIMRLMNNPVCKSEIIGTGVPFLSNVDILLKKLYLYSSLTPAQYPPNIGQNDFDVVYKNIYPGSPYENPSTAVLQFIPKVPGYLKIYPYPGSKVSEDLTDNILWPQKNKHIKGFDANQEIPILEVDLPENKLIRPSGQIKLLPYAPNILNVYEMDRTPKTDIDIISKMPTFDNGVQAYPYLKPVNPITQPDSVEYYPLGDSSHETFKTPSIVEQGETYSIPNYNMFTILENMPTSPADFNMPSDDSSTSLLDIDAYKDDIPINQVTRPSYDPYLPIEFEHPYQLSGDDSGETNIGQGRPSTGFELNLPSKIPELYLQHTPKGKLSPFQVIGKAETAYVDIGKNINNPALPFEGIGDEAGNFYNSENKPIPVLELDLPAKHSESLLQMYVPSISSTASPFEVTGNKGTADIIIGENNPEYMYDLNYMVKKPTLPFDILSPHIKRPSKDPNKYDKSPNSSPFINGYPDLYPDIPSNLGEPREPYEPKDPSDNYLLQTRPFMIPPFEFVDDRSGEILISSSPKPLNINQKLEEVLDFDYPQQVNEKFSSYPVEYQLPNMDDINHLYPSQPEYFEYFDIPKNSDIKNKAPSIQNQPKSSIPKIHTEELIPLYPYSPYQSNILPVPDYLEESKLSPSIPETYNHPSKNNILPGYPEDDDSPISYLPQEIVSKPYDVGSYGPNFQIENQYVIHNQKDIPYEDIQDSIEIFPDDTIISTIRPPVKWKYNNIPNINSPELPHLSKYPDKKILVIINDNIEVIEHKIPKSYLDSKIRKQIKIIKELMKLKKITFQEYVTILNQYEILIEYIKHSNIDNEILKELLLSMTNVGKLDLQNGKSNVVELTYLIKRPTPLIYQPYYYIKYRLPYTSFVTSMKTILSSSPYLSKYPSQLYKALIPMSKVAETSPDLESYGKSDIQRLIFNNGTLVGTKVIKGSDIGMYASLDKLKEINTDVTVEDLYKTIKNLDMDLQSSENNDRPYAVGINPSMVSNMNDLKFQLLQNNNGKAMDQITVKINRKPTITKKITKITTKKVTSNKIIADILNQVNSLRSSKSSHEAENNSNEITEHDEKIRSEPNVETSFESHHQESNSNQLVEINSSDQAVPTKENTVETHNNINQHIQANDKLAFDYVPMYTDNSNEHLNYYSKMNTADTDDVNAYSKEIFQLNKPNFSLQKFDTPSLSMFDKLLEATVNAKKSSVITTSHPFDTNPDLIKTKSSALITDEPKYVDSTWKIPPHGQSQSSIGAKLLDATLKAHDFKQLHNPNFSNIDQQPAHMLPGDSIYSNVNPYNANFDPREPSKIASPNSIKHSQTYSFGDPNNIYSNFDKTYQSYNPNNINPNFKTFSQQYNSVNPVDSYKYYNTYTIDNSNNFNKQYKPYSIDNFSNNLYNSGIKSSGYYVNYNKNLVNNNLMKYPILNYQKTSNDRFMFHPSGPIRTG